MKNASEQALNVILFTVGEQTYAVDMAFLEEVTELVPATPLPFVPAFVDGLINIAGYIMPQINLLRLLQQPSVGVESLIILQIQGVFLSLRVNQILENIAVTVKTIEPNEQCVIAEFEYQLKTVLLLGAEQLAALIKAKPQQGGQTSFLGKLKERQVNTEKFFDYFVFTLAEQHYAFRLEDVDEVIELMNLNAQPKAPDCVAGISLLRSEPRLVLYLAKLIQQEDDGTGRVAVVIDIDSAYVALLIDELVGIETVSEKRLRTGLNQQAMFERQDGSLIPILAIKDIIQQHQTIIKPFIPLARKQDRRVQIKQIEMLCFSLNGDQYVFPIQSVKRIVTDKHIEPLLTQQAWLMGTTEVDGKIIPVVNLPKQLGYNIPLERLTELVIVSEGGYDWALAIPVTEQVTAFDEDKLDAVEHDPNAYIVGYVNQQEQLLTVLNVAALCRANQTKQAV